MKICFKCDKLIDEDGEEPYVMLLIKKKGKIMEFVSYHFSCWEIKVKSPVAKEVKEKTNICSNCNKELKFWDSYMQGDNYICKDCWEEKERKLEESGQKNEKERLEESSKKK